MDNAKKGFSKTTLLSIFIISLFCLFLETFILCTVCLCGTEPNNEITHNPSIIDINSIRYKKLFTELESTYHFDSQELHNLFQNISIDNRVITLMDGQREKRSLKSYISLLFAPAVVHQAKTQLSKNKELLDTIEKEFKVDREYIVAIWAIETRFGEKQGKYHVFRTLNTLFDAYPRRSSFFRKQLIHFLLLCRENGLKPKEILGSYAGALGQPQFIPSSYREYAVSYDGDKKRDIFHSIPDTLASIANYLKRHHWVENGYFYKDIGKTLNSASLIHVWKKGRKGKIDWQSLVDTQQLHLPKPYDNRPLTISDTSVNLLLGGGRRFIAGYPNFQAIIAWNHSTQYALDVHRLAVAIKDR